MKRAVKVSCLFILVALSGCYEKEFYPDIPKISFNDIVFYEGEFADSLVLSFDFEDGGGDIGLSDGAPPYHIFDGIVDSSGRFILISSHPDSLISPFYTIPIEVRINNTDVNYIPHPRFAKFFSEDDLRTPYNCDDYFILDEDTLFVDRNIYNSNIYIEFEKKIGSSSGDFFEKFDLASADCESAGFDARIPFFESGAQKGIIKYNIQSIRLKNAFIDDIIRIKFWVYDRALNQSNIEYTKEFTLSEITQ